MPRSKNISSYEQFFWQLLEAMDSETPEITFDLPAHRAHRMRHRTYGFIYALEAEATRLRKQGEIETSNQIRRQANTFRTYLIQVVVNGTPVSQVKPYDTTPAQLKYINRDLTPENLALKEQLARQVPINGSAKKRAIEEELPELLPPTLDEFFDSPLSTPEGEDPELNADGPESTPDSSDESSS